MENRFKNNKWYQRYSKIIILSLFVIFFIATSIFIIYKGLDIVKTKTVVYVNNSDIDYFVYLKDNNYFSTPYLEKNEKYIASLIDKINIKFNYVLSGEEAMNGNYSYKIVSTVVVKEQNKDSVLWQNDYNLTETKDTNFTNQKTISVKDEIDIDYDYYNEIVNQFKKDYGVAIDADLIVKLVVVTDVDYGADSFVIKQEPLVDIPLSEKTIEIDISTSTNDVNTKEVTYTKYPTLNYFLIVIGIIFLIIYLLLGIKVIMKIIKAIKNSNKYDAYIRKIFGNYDQIIVDTDKLPNLEDIDVMEVKKFEDLVDAQNEVHKPIIFNELKKGKLAVFVLVDDKHAFSYTVKVEDFKK